MKNRSLLIFTNDFGFGPISRSHAIALALHNLDSSLRIIIITNGIDDYLFKATPNINFETIDNLRDVSKIGGYLDKYGPESTTVISTMNRFALKAAKKKGFKTILVDGLFWFWKKRPEEYDIADYQLRLVLPWQLNDKSSTEKIFYYAGPVEIPDNLSTLKRTSGSLVATLNGFTTPFYEPSHDVYLDLFAKLMNSLNTPEGLSVTGNKLIVSKIEHILSPTIRQLTLDKYQYLRLVNSSSLVLLNGGSNSFFECIALKKAFIFTLPSNQSQYALIHEVSKFTNLPMEFWCPALNLFENHERFSIFDNEAAAISFWSSQIKDVLSMDGFNVSMHQTAELMMTNSTKLKKNSQLGLIYASAKNSKESGDKIAKTIAKIVSL